MPVWVLLFKIRVRDKELQHSFKLVWNVTLLYGYLPVCSLEVARHIAVSYFSCAKKATDNENQALKARTSR